MRLSRIIGGDTNEDILSLEDGVIGSDDFAVAIKALEVLSGRERTVIEMRFGIGRWQRPHTLKEIGTAFRLTGSRIRIIESHAIAKLRLLAPVGLDTLKCNLSTGLIINFEAERLRLKDEKERMIKTEAICAWLNSHKFKIVFVAFLAKAWRLFVTLLASIGYKWKEYRRACAEKIRGIRTRYLACKGIRWRFNKFYRGMLNSQVDAVAGAMLYGLETGDAVAIVMHRQPHYV